MTEQAKKKIESDVSKYVFDNFVPELQKAVGDFIGESYSLQRISETVARITGKDTGVELGVIKIKQPLEELIKNISLIAIHHYEKSNKREE